MRSWVLSAGLIAPVSTKRTRPWAKTGACGRAASQVGEVADVVQPRGDLEQTSVWAYGGCEAAGPGGDALDERPAAGKSAGQEGAGEVLRPGCDGLHEVHASQPGRDVHGRGLASGDV
jgi:hypothetical protein